MLVDRGPIGVNNNNNDDPMDVSLVSRTPAQPNHWLSARLPLLVATADLCVLLFTFVFGLSRVESYTFDLRVDLQRLVIWCCVLAAIWLPIAVNMGSHQRGLIASRLQSGYVVAKSTLIAGALFHVVPLVGGPVYSRIASMFVVLTLVLVMALWRICLAALLPKAALRSEELVVLGAGWAGQTLAKALAAHPQMGVRIVAFVDSDPERIAQNVEGIPVYGIAELSRLVIRSDHTAKVVLAIPDEAHASVYDHLTVLAQAGAEVVSMANVYERVTGRVPVRHLGNYWWAMIPKPSSDIVYSGTKRTIDICLGLLGLIFLALLLPVVSILLKLDTPGPLFFTQMRVGRYGRPLKLVKIRTLRVSTVSFANNWERKRSNQASRLGAILRGTGIDELPQCWNVLKGEMSIVGPRPYVPQEVEDFQQQIPFFRCRSLVKPGLTGWAQINWGYGLSLEDEVEKLQYDLYYIGHQGFYLDLVIMLRTVALAMRRRLPLQAMRAHS
jgi:exopolysaccharide biosynthesis polyprenyl glycosylphosphotransferase